ncbi:MAG TPA: DUF3099 domain-containing protein [Actinomycetales bacterium]|nr:DUF3099 domain-containing protein [Actinomycetales bacterium]
MPASDPAGRSRRQASPGEPETFSISTAHESLDDEMHHRMKRYLISMSVRTVCFVLAVVFSGWLRWTMAAAAIVLPYVAVVMANAGPRKTAHTAEKYTPEVRAIGTDPTRPVEQEPPG